MIKISKINQHYLLKDTGYDTWDKVIHRKSEIKLSRDWSFVVEIFIKDANDVYMENKQLFLDIINEYVPPLLTDPDSYHIRIIAPYEFSDKALTIKYKMTRIRTIGDTPQHSQFTIDDLYSRYDDNKKSMITLKTIEKNKELIKKKQQIIELEEYKKWTRENCAFIVKYEHKYNITPKINKYVFRLKQSKIELRHVKTKIPKLIVDNSFNVYVMEKLHVSHIIMSFKEKLLTRHNNIKVNVIDINDELKSIKHQDPINIVTPTKQIIVVGNGRFTNEMYNNKMMKCIRNNELKDGDSFSIEQTNSGHLYYRNDTPFYPTKYRNYKKPRLKINNSTVITSMSELQVLKKVSTLTKSFWRAKNPIDLNRRTPLLKSIISTAQIISDLMDVVIIPIELLMNVCWRSIGVITIVRDVLYDLP
jgi:hypothetical protein